jgi:hypothetical protein
MFELAGDAVREGMTSGKRADCLLGQLARSKNLGKLVFKKLVKLVGTGGT